MTRFDSWMGVKDLTFIIPKNFSNITQKNGGNKQSLISNNNHFDQVNDDDASLINRNKNEPSFIGLKSPDHLKKVCNMFRNAEHKNNP